MDQDGPMGERTRVLSHLPSVIHQHVQQVLPDDVELVAVPQEGPVPDEAWAEILLSTGGNDATNLAEVLDRGVRWVHAISTGVENFPLELLGDRVFTCSRGASGVAISEWVFAMIL